MQKKFFDSYSAASRFNRQRQPEHTLNTKTKKKESKILQHQTLWMVLSSFNSLTFIFVRAIHHATAHIVQRQSIYSHIQKHTHIWHLVEMVVRHIIYNILIPNTTKTNQIFFWTKSNVCNDVRILYALCGTIHIDGCVEWWHGRRIPVFIK